MATHQPPADLPLQPHITLPRLPPQPQFSLASQPVSAAQFAFGPDPYLIPAGATRNIRRTSLHDLRCFARSQSPSVSDDPIATSLLYQFATNLEAGDRREQEYQSQELREVRKWDTALRDLQEEVRRGEEAVLPMSMQQQVALVQAQAQGRAAAAELAAARGMPQQAIGSAPQQQQGVAAFPPSTNTFRRRTGQSKAYEGLLPRRLDKR